MKVVKAILLLVIIGSLGVTGVGLVKVIDVQRNMGEKQAGLVEDVKRQNDSIKDISKSFKPTEEMVGKTERMLTDLKELSGVIDDMNSLVAQANSLQGVTGQRLDLSNNAINGLQTAVAGAGGPLGMVAERTAKTLSYINATVDALSRMAGGLAATNGSAAQIANMMEGKF